MRSTIITFIVWVVIISAVCVAIENVLPANLRLDSAYTLLTIFALSVTAVHTFLVYSAQGSDKAFVNKFMLGTMLKFFFYLTILIGFLLYSKADPKALALHFLFYYVVFTVLEVNRLFAAFKKK